MGASRNQGYRGFAARRSKDRSSEPRKIANVLSTLMARRGYAQQQSAADCEDVWRQAVGSPLAGHTRIGGVKNGVLEVLVRNSSVLQELTFQKKQLLKKLADTPQGRSIRNLRFRVGAID